MSTDVYGDPIVRTENYDDDETLEAIEATNRFQCKVIAGLIAIFVTTGFLAYWISR